MKVIPIKPADPDARCFFDLPRELRDIIYEFYFINYRRAVRRAKAKGESFRERKRGSDEDDGEDETEESDGNTYPSEESDNHSIDENSDQDDSDSSSEFRPPGGYRHRSEIPDAHFSDANKVRFSTYRDEIVINQDQKLHACLPLLTRTSRQLLAETWSFSFDVDYKFVVHFDSYNIRPLVERRGVFRLLSDICGTDKIGEGNTTVVMHGATGEDDLKWWLKKHWYERLPLFDTNLEIMFKARSSPTGSKSYVHHKAHPICQLRARYQRKCLGIIKYMRLVNTKNSEKWEELVLRMVDRLNQVKRKKFEHARQYHRPVRGASRMTTPEAEVHTDLFEAMFDAVEWMVRSGGKQHQVNWEWDAERLASATFRTVRDEVKNLYGSEFEVVEEKHRQTVLPMNEK